MAMYTNWKYIVNNLLGHKHKMAIMYDHGNILAMYYVTNLVFGFCLIPRVRGVMRHFDSWDKPRNRDILTS